jgi:hypothetical protein
LSERETLIESIERQKRILKAEYQRGYADGGEDMNKKWLITRQEDISEIANDLEEIQRELTIDDSVISEVARLKTIKKCNFFRKKWEEKRK